MAKKGLGKFVMLAAAAGAAAAGISYFRNISLSIRNWMRISTILKMRRIHLFRTVP